MSENKPFLNVLNNRKEQSIPFWFMRQAGRYLPEYRKLRAEKGGFLDMAMDPETACEITMQPLRRFGMDAAIIFSDILVVPMALGCKLEFTVGEGPKLDPVQSGQDILALDPAGLETLDFVYEALQKTRNAFVQEGFDRTALIGFAGAPWTVATYMIEGGSSRDFFKSKTLAYQNPQWFTELIKILTHATAQYLIKQIEAGAEAVQVFDSWSGVLDSDQFDKWVIGPTRDIVVHIRKVYPHTPIIGFPKGAGYNFLSYVRETGVSAIGLDSHVPTAWAAEELQSLKPVQGNLDPACLLAGGDALISGTRQIIQNFRNGPFIFNLGHGIHKETPVEHVEILVRTIRNFPS